MKYYFTIILIFFFLNGNSQENKSHLSIGGRKWGLGFGYARDYNGLRLNLQDYSLERTNGINFLFSSRGADYIRKRNLLEYNRDSSYTNGISIAVFETPFQKVNGISISLLHNQSPKVNGLSLGFISLNSGVGYTLSDDYLHKFKREQNGIAISGLFMDIRKCKGIAITGLWAQIDTLYGLAIAPSLSHRPLNNKTFLEGIAIAGEIEISTVKGVLISVNSRVKDMKGCQIGLINQTKTIKGFQIGFLNNVKTNPKLLRWLPIFNTNFRKTNKV
jgi:hypothetical protein